MPVWDRVQLITAGFTPNAQSLAVFGARRAIRAVVWHDMEGWLAGALARWNSGVAGAHLCVLRSGEIVLTVKPEDVAWHAGTSNDPSGGMYGRTPFWRSHNINPYSLGVELEGFESSGYTDAQRASCRRIADWATATYGVPRRRSFDDIDGHHTHGELSSSRTDPGPLFSWAWVL